MAVGENEVDDTQAAAAAAAAADETAASHEDAFAEFAEKKEADLAPAEKPAPTDAGKPEDDEAAKAAEAAAASAAAAEGTKEAPLKQEVGKKPDLTKIKRDALSPEDRAALDAAQSELHRYRSDEPRQAFWQNRASVLEAELAAARAGKAAPPKEGAKPLSEDPAIQKMLQDLPENSPVVEALQRLSDRIDGATASVANMTETQRQAAYKAEDDAFLEVHPDFPDIKASGKFGPWLLSKPKSIQDIAKKHTAIVTDAAEAVELVNMFKLENGIALKPAAVVEKKDPAPKQPNARRDAQLAAAKTAPAQKGPDVTGGGTDDEKLFASYAAAKERKRA